MTKDEKQLEFAKLKLEYLKDILRDEERRQTLLESKNGTLLTQCAAVLSANVVIVTILMQHKDKLPFPILCAVGLLELTSILLSATAVLSSARTFFIHRFKYMRGDPDTAKNPASEISFLTELLDDAHDCIACNIKINNTKAEHIITSNKFLHASLIFLVSVGLTILISSVFTNVKGQYNNSGTSATHACETNRNETVKKKLVDSNFLFRAVCNAATKLPRAEP